MSGFCPLASGSQGNSILLKTPHTKILIDAGGSGRTIESRLNEVNVDVGDIKGILITHDHVDHIQALKVFAGKYGIPVMANQGTARGIVERLGQICKFKIFTTGDTFEFEDLEIHPFSVQHDTADPVAFTIRLEGAKLGFCTDLGFVTTLVKAKLRECDYLYVEANHQPSMVHACARPMVYKQRVLGRSGHLSNEACGDLLADIVDGKTKHVHLAHLSQECNNPETAKEVVADKLKPTGFTPEISIAYQDRISRAVTF